MATLKNRLQSSISQTVKLLLEEVISFLATERKETLIKVSVVMHNIQVLGCHIQHIIASKGNDAIDGFLNICNDKLNESAWAHVCQSAH